MTLRAIVTRSTGRTRHTWVAGAADGKIERGAYPVPTTVEISDLGGEFLLVHYDGKGAPLAHTHHATLDEAMDQAEFEFDITRGEWKESNAGD